MHADTLEQIDSVILKIQRLLGKIDRLRLPMASRRDVESILVRQVTGELDRALPWQAGHATETAFIAAGSHWNWGLISPRFTSLDWRPYFTTSDS
jgi:hypothetical protein